MEKLILTSCQETTADGASCGQAAEVIDDYKLPSTDTGGETLVLTIQCVNRHRFMTLLEKYVGDTIETDQLSE